MARLLAHVPDPRRHLVHYYGAYSNVVRGKLKRAGVSGPEAAVAALGADPAPRAAPSLSALRRRWAELIRRVYEVDPLVCPRCKGAMRVISFITEPRLIRRILDHLVGAGLSGRAPPRASVAVRG